MTVTTILSGQGKWLFSSQSCHLIRLSHKKKYNCKGKLFFFTPKPTNNIAVMENYCNVPPDCQRSSSPEFIHRPAAHLTHYSDVIRLPGMWIKSCCQGMPVVINSHRVSDLFINHRDGIVFTVYLYSSHETYNIYLIWIKKKKNSLYLLIVGFVAVQVTHHH